jgi:uncharacterized membrane protein
MMDSLRTAANSLVLKIIFGIIIVSFILTGVSGYLIGGGNNYAAKVNDTIMIPKIILSTRLFAAVRKLSIMV